VNTHTPDSLGENPHRGISMHEMPVGGNFPGLVFALGSMLIFLFAIPALWYVVGAALVLGIVLALLLQTLHRTRPDETSQLRLKL
jgi:bacteriorhodopsin